MMRKKSGVSFQLALFEKRKLEAYATDDVKAIRFRFS